jgi:hypothetical protein
VSDSHDNTWKLAEAMPLFISVAHLFNLVAHSIPDPEATMKARFERKRMQMTGDPLGWQNSALLLRTHKETS